MSATEPKTVQRTGHPWLSSLSGRMSLVFCTLTLTLLLAMQFTEMYGLPFGLFEGEIKEATNQELEHLSRTADSSKKLLELWLAERRGDGNVIAQSPALAEMAAAYRRSRTVAPTSAFAEWLDALSYTFHYSSVRILDPVSGKTLAGNSSGDHYQLPADILDSARRPGYEETISFSAGAAGHPPRLLIIRQVGQGLNRDEAPVMLLVMTVDFEAVVKLLLEKSRTGELGKSGETVIVNNNGLFLTSVRHPLADGKPVVPLDTVSQGKPDRLAVEGGDGTVIATDYRGVKVLAAYRHIPLNPEISWGLVVKVDEAEALEEVQG